MKKHILRIMASLILVSAVISGCSVEYRDGHRGHGYDHHDHDHEYRNR